MGRAVTGGTLCFLVALGGLWSRPVLATAVPSPVVEEVEARVFAEAGLPGPLRERLAASVARVAERLLLGRRLAELEESSEEEQVITTVFGRILTGYRIEEVKITAARAALVEVRLVPEDPRVAAVHFAWHVRGITDEAAGFLDDQLKAGEALWAGLFTSIPLAAFSWAEPILIAGLKEALTASFPGFQAEVGLLPAATTLRVEVSLTPFGPLAEETRVELVSRNLPRLIVYRWTDKARTACGWVTGLPLAYLRRYQPLLERRCAERLAADELTRRFDLVWQVRLFPGAVTRGRVEVGAGHYSLAANGELFLGPAAYLAFRLEGGVRLGPEWELGGRLAVNTGGEVCLAGSLFYEPDGETALGMTKVFGGRESIWLRYRHGVLSWGLEQALGDDGLSTAWVALTAQEGLTWRLSVNSRREYGLGVVFSF